MADTLWADKDSWPANPINFVFLLEATDKVGRAMFGDEWRRPSFDQNDSSGPQFRRIIKMIAEACETDELPAAYQQSGEMMSLEARYWHVEDWKYYFVDGDIEIPVDMFASTFGAETMPVTWEKYPIFVRSRELASFIAKVQPQTTGEPQPIPARSGFPGRPSSSQLVDGELDRRIVALKDGQFLGANIKEIAESLSAWLKVTHPDKPQATAKSIGNRLGRQIRQHVSTPARK